MSMPATPIRDPDRPMKAADVRRVLKTPDLSPLAKCIALYIRSLQSIPPPRGLGACVMSAAQLALVLESTPRSVERALRDLKRRGWIATQRRGPSRPAVRWFVDGALADPPPEADQQTKDPPPEADQQPEEPPPRADEDPPPRAGQRADPPPEADVDPPRVADREELPGVGSSESPPPTKDRKGRACAGTGDAGGRTRETPPGPAADPLIVRAVEVVSELGGTPYAASADWFQLAASKVRTAAEFDEERARRLNEQWLERFAEAIREGNFDVGATPKTWWTFAKGGAKVRRPRGAPRKRIEDVGDGGGFSEALTIGGRPV